MHSAAFIYRTLYLTCPLSSVELYDCEEYTCLFNVCNELSMCVSRDAKNIHSKYMRHQAFESEIAANKAVLEKLQKDGDELMEEKPDSREVVSF